mmetsp:Transcript_26623/g.29676  ORF Transcript_26623/g.29676 Transcript_26623/m.29676 type:complete len:302 (+) Transcript_26623:77-982(+)|eukprot:CAMPEP_0168532336 /NCGR_PEP_ID=MMETSP0405-20121227/16154_1 /TAXON_ID=498012 /ORGANISM="Trichosphaerium sp, Strain Am-I-7 wt" /LENGTH=301 /DNA_ID=CAMNT_0008557653 /DNA_START=47 /DNA_END=952 /DNA_ORIENTATION=+
MEKDTLIHSESTDEEEWKANFHKYKHRAALFALAIVSYAIGATSIPFGFFIFLAIVALALFIRRQDQLTSKIETAVEPMWVKAMDKIDMGNDQINAIFQSILKEEAKGATTNTEETSHKHHKKSSTSSSSHSTSGSHKKHSHKHKKKEKPVPRPKPSGIIKITLLHAEDLKVADMTRSDPYVIMSFQGDEQKSEVYKRKLTFDFKKDEPFAFDVSPENEDYNLEFKVKDWDAMGKHDNLGSASLDMTALVNSLGHSQEVAITLENVKKGVLTVNIEYIPDSVQKKPASESSGLRKRTKSSK